LQREQVRQSALGDQTTENLARVVFTSPDQLRDVADGQGHNSTQLNEHRIPLGGIQVRTPLNPRCDCGEPRHSDFGYFVRSLGDFGLSLGDFRLSLGDFGLSLGDFTLIVRPLLKIERELVPRRSEPVADRPS
jgi:hypothetical protein